MNRKLWPVVLLVVLGMLAGVVPAAASAPAPAPAAADVTLTVMVPQGTVAVQKELAPRLSTLDGKKVALWLSATPDETYAGKGDEYYAKLADLLKKQFPKIEIISPDKMPRKYSPADEVLKGITDLDPDAVVIAFGGWWGCINAMGSIATKLEQAGIPTVATTVERQTARFMGSVLSQGYVDYPAMFFDEVSTLTKAGAEADAEKAVDFVVKALTKFQPQYMKKDGKLWTPSNATLTYTGATYADALAKFNNSFLTEWQWGDGLPLEPPTKDKVDALMKMVPYTPTLTIGNWGPSAANFTIEKIAVNAAMAGAEPEQFPVIVAALQAITSVKWDNYQPVMKSAVPLVVVNGPIVKQIGMNDSSNVFGPSALHSANSNIGRAIMLSMRNIGNSGKGMEPSNLAGNAAAFAGMVIGEEEDIEAMAKGWDPLNVQLGAKAGTNSVTVLGVDQMNFSISGTAKNAAAFVAPEKGNWPSTKEAWEKNTAGVVVMSPMMIITEGIEKGVTKKDIQEEMYEGSMISQDKFKGLVLTDEDGKAVEPTGFVKDMLAGMKKDEMVPMAASADKFLVVACGGLWTWAPYTWLGSSQWMNSAVTKEIKLPTNWATLLPKAATTK